MAKVNNFLPVITDSSSDSGVLDTVVLLVMLGVEGAFKAERGARNKK